jgi:hypothetical protein
LAHEHTRADRRADRSRAGGLHIHPDDHPDSWANSGPGCDFPGDSTAHRAPDTDACSNTDAGADAHANTYANAHSCTYRHAHPHADSHADRNSNSDAHGRAYARGVARR